MFVSASSKSLLRQSKYLLPLVPMGLIVLPQTYQLTIDVLADAILASCDLCRYNTCGIFFSVHTALCEAKNFVRYEVFLFFDI